ncbi:gamma-glutamyltransferase [Nordella sp. HKS 07]|nr:gamma-glutamyltransferase [Nordella sp. HKS 07]
MLLADAFASRERPVLTGRTGAVSAADPFAAAAAQEILTAGGSAVDAMVAAQAVLAVVAPDACGLGGDMLCLIREPDGNVLALNGTGAAPAKLTKVATDGGAGITVPGMVAAWDVALERHGRLSFSRVLEPAIRIARLGMRMPASLARAAQTHRPRLERYGAGQWGLLAAQVGDLVIQNELAMTLDRIGKEGLGGFYRGECAAATAAAVQAQGGALSIGDLASHQTIVADPIAVTFRGARLMVQPPISQGVLLAMAAQALSDLGDVPGDRLDHAAIELTEASFAYRDHIAEGDRLLKKKLTLDLDKAGHRGGPRAYLHTAGVSVADRHGCVVSSLVSVFDDFGSGVLVPECGFVLNNRAGGFTRAPNDAAPGKRPVHTLAPAMLETARGAIALSTPGADGQVQTLLQVLSGLMIEGIDLATAIGRPRWRSENGLLLVEQSHPRQDLLAELGHKVTPMRDGDMRAGAVTAAGSIDGAPIACGDWRRHTWAGIV